MWSSHAVMLAFLLAISPGRHISIQPVQPVPPASTSYNPRHQCTAIQGPAQSRTTPPHWLLRTSPSWPALPWCLCWLASCSSCNSLGGSGGGGNQRLWGAEAAVVDSSRKGVQGEGSGQATTGAGSGAVNPAGGGGSGGSGGGDGGGTAWDAGDGICSDTCPLARNGICEDGSNIVGSDKMVGIQVACDFGTDCTDCGPYKGTVTTWGTDVGFRGPIDYLTRQGFKVWARSMDFQPRIIFGYTDPKADLDVSEKVDRAGCLEVGIMQVFREVLEGPCGAFRPNGTKARGGAGTASPPAGRPPLVVDAGANFGYFTLYAAALGCRVVAIEPVPRFLAFLHWNLAANGLRAITSTTSAAAGDGGDGGSGGGAGSSPGSTVVVVDRALSKASGTNVTMLVPKSGVWGAASLIRSAFNPEQETEFMSVQTVQLDEVVGNEQVSLLKVDVEGYETEVMRSAERLLSEGRAPHILLEYSPGVPEMLEALARGTGQVPVVQADDPPKMLLRLLRQGYSMVFLNDNFAKSGDIIPLPFSINPLEEIVEQNLLHDLTDVYWFRNYSSVRCPWPSELVQHNPIWAEGCFRAPDDSHPKGLRVTFPFNTNIWMARNRTTLPIRGSVGLFGPGQDERTSWWSEKSAEMGVGARVCTYLPPELQLRSRCPCSRAEVCGAEQEVLLRALAERRLPQRPPPMEFPSGA